MTSDLHERIGRRTRDDTERPGETWACVDAINMGSGDDWVSAASLPRHGNTITNMPDDGVTQNAPAGGPPPTTELEAAGPPVTEALAYSAHTTSMPVVDYEPEPRRWWVIALVLAAAGAVAAAAFMLGRGHRHEPPNIVAEPTPATSVSPAPEMSPTDRQNSVLFALLDKYRISYVHRADAISTAHSVCEALDNGQTFGSLETALIESASGAWGVRDSDQFLDASIEAYCPKYRDLVPSESLQGPFDGSLREGAEKPPASSSPEPSTAPATPNAAPAPPPVAATPSVDDRFLSTLDAAGIGYTNRAGQIGQGRQVCAALDGGESYAQLYGEMNSTAWSAGVIRAAVSAYCPAHANVLP